MLPYTTVRGMLEKILSNQQVTRTHLAKSLGIRQKTVSKIYSGDYCELPRKTQKRLVQLYCQLA